MLIEVLVSMLISALAVLALASVHAASMRYSKMSQHRALATHLALDIGERMRANKGSAATLDGAEGFLAGAYDYAVSFAGQADDVARIAELQRQLELSREPAGIPLRYQVWRVQLQA